MNGAEIRIDREGAPGILDLAAQHRAKLQSREGESDRGPQIEPGAAAQVGDQRLQRHRGRRWTGEEGIGAETHQQDAREIGPQRARVLQPAPGAKADDVERNGTASQSATRVAGRT